MKKGNLYKTRLPLQMILALSALLIAALACGSEPSRKIDPTLLAPMDLSKQDLRYKNMPSFDFSGKDMREVLMTGSNITRANFTNADLRNADLSDVIAYEAIFNGADLRGAKLDRLCMQSTTWTDAKLDPHWSEMVGLLAEGYQITTDLAGRDLSGVCIKDYELKGLNLSAANFSNAQLGGTNFAGSNLQQVNFTEARMGSAYLVGANLKGATVTKEQLDNVILCRTTLPDGQISNRDCHLLLATPTP